ncbi:GNAT family N-acetyltransferase [Rossellomorea sp. YZS02]|uniref:GNAT family N-acetyltransferase n=1 Tax=Rossellomorea sp. YZS02 TaxID=3097358 RepID=UPI002A146DFB|nr:GNAT family N-acetyltransferase [Rossellomorea sp. YZS02]MDX8342133.1 GNAT family N-acetyltransferase [Rossellomorea sp. YZS02]
MMTFEENHLSKWKVEHEVMNSHPAYNLLSKNREVIGYEEICAEYEESEKLGTIRLLIKKDSTYIGLVDYCLCNPKDQCPWISLFVIHKEFQKTGYALEAYRQFEQLIRNENQSRLRLAVHIENVKGLRFWSKLGFERYKKVEYEGMLHDCLERML